jgi:single-stranded DNA-binding protein
VNGLHVAATGRVTFDGEMQYTQGGKARLVFSMVADQGYTATEGRPAPDPLYLRVTAWEDTALALADSLKKGSAVYCEGRVKLDRWTDKATAEPRAGLSLSAWRCEVHGAIGKQRPPREQEATAAGTGGHLATSWADYSDN